jgi:hypothetical protein
VNLFKLIGNLVPSITGLISEAVTDKDKAAELQFKIKELVLGIQSQVIAAKQAIIVAEAQGQSWIQRNWRPITMLTFVFIIANNYILVPYAVSFGLNVPMLDIPPGMWGLLTVGIGGYIGGRTYEKAQKINADSERARLEAGSG